MLSFTYAKKKKIIKGEPPTISNHSIRAQQFSLSFALQKRTRGGEVFEKHTSILYHFISWQKNNFSPLSAQQGSHCPKRFNSLWVKRKRLFYSDTLYPGYIKQNQRRHLHTVSVSCVRSFRQEQLSLRIKEGGFAFLNWAERGEGEREQENRATERKRLRKETKERDRRFPLTPQCLMQFPFVILSTQLLLFQVLVFVLRTCHNLATKDAKAQDAFPSSTSLLR